MFQYFLDINYRFSITGIENCISSRNNYLMRCPLSYHGIEVLKNSISEIVMTLNSPIKKVILYVPIL